MLFFKLKCRWLQSAAVRSATSSRTLALSTNKFYSTSNQVKTDKTLLN